LTQSNNRSEYVGWQVEVLGAKEPDRLPWGDLDLIFVNGATKVAERSFFGISDFDKVCCMYLIGTVLDCIGSIAVVVPYRPSEPFNSILDLPVRQETGRL
jgi:hypothetical protein